MPIFQKSVIKKHLRGLNKIWLNKTYDKFKDIFTEKKIQTIIKLKEEEYQDGFLRDIFVEILGYKIKPDDNFNLVREFKNKTDGKKADGAIIKNQKAIAVIELKSTRTKDLTSITQQAFNYKINQPGCKYVITSNFQKMRFYIDYANEYEEFDLFNMQKNKFELMYLILRKDAIFNDLPYKLKEETRFHEKNISEQLYKDYSNFKNKIFENIVKRNPEIDKLTLFKKSQKLLDRLLFIFFAEDCGLLPANSISRIIERYEQLKKLDAYKPLYEIYLQYFGYMNIGRKGQIPADDIPAYNGGLFVEDKILDKLKIDDKVLKADSLKLSAYDFNTDVDVNILGHIFEHSLNEIEEIEQKINLNIEGLKSTSKRKKDGVFYTPKYITQYIVENTIGTLCTEKRKEMNIYEIEFDNSYNTKRGKLNKKGKELFSNFNKYKKWLESLKILDPACGSGAFLNQALQFLIKEHKFIDDLTAELTKQKIRLFDTDKNILENNLFGVDINEESVDIAKLSLWLRTAQKGRKLSTLNENIKCGNSLIDDPKIAGNKAFNWNIEFKEIMKNGGFDVVIGNPPYVGQKGNKELFVNFKSKQWNEFYQRKQDLYYYFYKISIDLLKKNGYLGYITPQSWLTAYAASNLRKYMSNNSSLIKIWDTSEIKIFIDANINSMSFIFQKNKKNKKIYIESGLKNTTNYKVYISKIENNKLNQQNWNIFKMPSYVDITKNVDFIKLSEIATISPGIQTGCDKVTKKHLNKYNIENSLLHSGIFIIDETDIDFNKITEFEKSFLKPLYKNSDINRYYCNTKNKFWLLNTNLIDDINTVPIIKKHLKKYKNIILNRYENFALKRAYKANKWWFLYGYRPNTNFDSEKIIFPYRSLLPKFTVIKKAYYGSIDIFYLTSLNRKFDYNFILAILNSNLISYFISKNFKKKGKIIEFYKQPMSELPIPLIELKNQQPFIEKADKMLSLNKVFQTDKDNFLQTLREEKSLLKLSRKLQNFHNLEYDEFKKELRKKKVKFSLGTENNEWREYFNTSKEKINKLQTQINQTDKEIDKMVYELYKLTDKEIEIVEKSVK